MRYRLFLLLSATASFAACGHTPDQHHGHAPPAAGHAAAPADSRVAVVLPATLRQHTLANMRDHLLALQEIQFALSQQAFDRAADVAESRLGMSSLGLHGAHEVARFMPPGMRDAGTAMHRAASRLALAARDAGASGELLPALAAYAEVMSACVACHAGYRLE
jgi:hypothetical protein